MTDSILGMLGKSDMPDGYRKDSGILRGHPEYRRPSLWVLSEEVRARTGELLEPITYLSEVDMGMSGDVYADDGLEHVFLRFWTMTDGLEPAASPTHWRVAISEQVVNDVMEQLDWVARESPLMVALIQLWGRLNSKHEADPSVAFLWAVFDLNAVMPPFVVDL